jgi:hypothetical protein
MPQNRVILDPSNVNITIRLLSALIDFDDETQEHLCRVIELFPRSAILCLDVSDEDAFLDLPLMDRFTFDLETDELILFSRDPDTLIDALIEMAMYLSGFATLLGNEDSWVTEFTIGAWKPVKKRLKLRLNIPIEDHPRFVISLPSATTQQADLDPELRELVSHFDRVTFDQIIALAGRDDLAIRFPPQTHPKVLALYLHTRRAIHEVAQDIELSDYPLFNARLLEKIQTLEKLFAPTRLTSRNTSDLKDFRGNSSAGIEQPGSPANAFSDSSSSGPSRDDPFSAFIEDLLANDDDNSDID